MAWWHTCTICGDIDHQCEPDLPPSIHVYREKINGEEVWYCGCCAAPVPFDHICGCEREH